MKNQKIILGYVPVMRDTLPVGPAAELRDKIRARVEEILSRQIDVELVAADGMIENGMLWDVADVPRLTAYFQEKKVDAMFFPHCNFGQEEPTAMLAKAIGKPVLLWGPRDPAPVGTEFRVYDTQCGMFATAKAFSRYGVVFSYIENCALDSEILEQGLDRFIRVAAVVKTTQGMRVGQIGLRPRQFLSVKINESELLEKFGIEITPIWTDEITSVVEKLRTGNRDLIGATKKMELPMALAMHGIQLENKGPDPAIAERMADIRKKIDCSGITEEILEKIAVIELAIEEIARLNALDAVAFECWAYLADTFGIPACFILGDLIDRGLIAACETDIHAAITSRMLFAAARGQSCPFIADLTIRHPTNDNAELLWHCGPFATSLKKDGIQGSICNCKGFFEIKGGDITLARMDQSQENYMLFADQAVGVDGPVTNGNYVWVETSDWPKWERKLMYGPYIHHICGIHGKYADVLKEACRYIGNLTHDSVNEIPEFH